MGALTLKSFPFELRGWDIEKFESIDPTDGFGSNTRVYISKQQVIQIEPDYNETNSSNSWITNKGRQFFDSTFSSWQNENTNVNKTGSYNNIIKTLLKNLYLLEHCNNKQQQNYSLTVVFENLSLEILSLLVIISQNYSFLTLKRAENIKLNNDLESNFQLNSVNTQTKLNSSTLCLLIGNNPRYEGYHLNLNLKQRFLKGNFKCLNIGSLIDLTFPIDFLGTNTKIIKTIAEGNNLICQEFKSARNPLLVFNTELFKRHNGKNILEMFKIIKYSNLFNKTWNGLNVLNSSLYETGTQVTALFPPVTQKDLAQFSSLYFINTTLNNTVNFKKITETKLLNYISYTQNYKQPIIDTLFIDQNTNNENNFNFCKTKNFNKYFYIPTKMFYENKETFINTEGLIKSTNKLISKRNSKNNWKLMRTFLKHSKKHLNFLNTKNNFITFFNSKKQMNFKNFIAFQYYAVDKIGNISFLLNNKNQPFFINNKTNLFKQKSLKLVNTKIKYWLDDFFIGGNDSYSKNSLVLTNCSVIFRNQSTNFF